MDSERFPVFAAVDFTALPDGGAGPALGQCSCHAPSSRGNRARLLAARAAVRGGCREVPVCGPSRWLNPPLRGQRSAR